MKLRYPKLTATAFVGLAVVLTVAALTHRSFLVRPIPVWQVIVWCLFSGIGLGNVLFMAIDRPYRVVLAVARRDLVGALHHWLPGSRLADAWEARVQERSMQEEARIRELAMELGVAKPREGGAVPAPDQEPTKTPPAPDWWPGMWEERSDDED